MKCPNKNHSDWKAIVSKYNEEVAWAAYIRNEEVIPPLTYVDSWLSNKIVDKSTQSYEKEKEYLQSIKNVITSQLEQMGFSVGALTEYDERVLQAQGGGIFDPTTIDKAKQLGLNTIEIIRIAQGHSGDKSLPEEYAHLVDAALHGTDNPIYNRLTRLLSNPDIVKQVFEQDSPGSFDVYSVLYDNDMERLTAEARAKLIAKHIIRNEQIKASPWQSLMQRVKDLFVRYFSRGDANDLQYQLYKADKAYGQFAAKLMGGQVQISINLDSLRNKNMMLNAQTTLSKAESSLKKIVETEHKISKILESGKKLTEAQEEYIKKRDINIERLEAFKNRGESDKGIINFMQYAINDMEEIMKQIQDLKIHNGIPTSSINSTAKFLRSLKLYIDGYSPLLKTIVSYTNTAEYQSQSVVDLTDSLKDLTAMLQRVEVQYEEAAIPLFTQFIKQYKGNIIGERVGGRVITEEFIDNLILESQQDIGVLDRWLFAASESSDLLVRLTGRVIKNSQFYAQDEARNRLKILQKAQEDLEKAGHTTDFIYERDKRGNLTGKYIQEIDWNRFYKEQSKEQERLDKLYGSRNNPKTSREWWKAFRQWQNNHMTQDSASQKWVPKTSLYTNTTYANLTPAQRKFYNTFIQEKQRADSRIPDNKLNPYLVPQVRKDFLERLKSAKSMKEARKLIGSGIADKWVRRESDDEFGSVYQVQDFDGTMLESIPLLYTKKLDDMNNLSTDVVSSMALYMSMAYNYDAMNKIVDIMEVGRDIMEDRKINETIGGKNVIEKFQHGGRTIMNKAIKPKGSSNFIDRVNDLYSTQIYGQYSKDQGGFNIPFIDAQISIAKTADNINQAVALNTYAFNTLSGVANVLMGHIMIRIESIAGQYFNNKELAQADLKYAQSLPQTIGQIGKRRKTNKFDLMMEKFNVFQDFHEAMRKVEMNKKNIFARMCNSSAFFFANNCGEHFIQSRTFLALAHRMKLKDASGNDITLWEAYEVVKDSNGIEQVQLKQGVTKLNGAEFTLEDVEKLARKSARINQKLHGIYNKEDMNAFQRLAQGRLAMMFRKWIVSSFNRRFQGENYSFEMDEVEEGYYSSVWNFMKVLAKDISNNKINLAMRWGELTDTQRRNMWRSIAEVGFLLASAIGYSVLSGQWDGDDEWYKSFILYQLRRIQTEIGVFVPTGYTQAKEGLKLIQSPGAGIRYMDNLLGVMAVWDIFRDPLQSGMYEGWNPYVRNLVRNVPFVSPIQKAMYPEESTKFYTNSRQN